MKVFRKIQMENMFLVVRSYHIHHWYIKAHGQVEKSFQINYIKYLKVSTVYPKEDSSTHCLTETTEIIVFLEKKNRAPNRRNV